MLRRHLLVASLPLVAGVPSRAASSDPATVLRLGGVAVLLRHAATEPGFGDPPGFRVDECTTQRNLSAEGRAQAQRLGAWFAGQGLRPAAVRSSRWCRCLDTARLAFGAAEPWEALDSFFGNRGAEPAQSRSLRAALQRIPAGRFEAWVTHQVNITVLTGEAVAMGEGFVVAPHGDAVRVAARLVVA
jgi:broad specificity phosphatase PhoE